MANAAVHSPMYLAGQNALDCLHGAVFDIDGYMPIPLPTVRQGRRASLTACFCRGIRLCRTLLCKAYSARWEGTRDARVEVRCQYNLCSSSSHRLVGVVFSGGTRCAGTTGAEAWRIGRSHLGYAVFSVSCAIYRATSTDRFEN